jgi:hypothetical protein
LPESVPTRSSGSEQPIELFDSGDESDGSLSDEQDAAYSDSASESGEDDHSDAEEEGTVDLIQQSRVAWSPVDVTSWAASRASPKPLYVRMNEHGFIDAGYFNGEGGLSRSEKQHFEENLGFYIDYDGAGTTQYRRFDAMPLANQI